MSIDPIITRRAVLVAAATGAGAVALAACSSSSSAEDSGKSAAATSGGSDDSGSAASSSGGGKTGTTLALLDEISVGSAKSVKLPDGSPAVVARPTSTTAACFSAKCTHMGCTVSPKGQQLVCPCHGSIFNASTGAVENGPAASPLPKLAVQVVDGKVVTAV
jgi:Rieske Fe-S protein